MSTYEELPKGSHGSESQEHGAELFRERWADGEPVRVWVHGTHRNGGTSSTSGFVIADREQLRKLLTDLQGAYYGWPGDHR